MGDAELDYELDKLMGGSIEGKQPTAKKKPTKRAQALQNVNQPGTSRCTTLY